MSTSPGALDEAGPPDGSDDGRRRGHRGGRRRDPEREAAILAATAELLVEVGYAGLTFEAVAARAGAGRATIYRRWDSTAGLVVAAVRSHLDEPVTVPDTGDLRGDLLALLDDYAGTRASTKTRLLAGLVHAIGHDPELRAVVHDQLLDITDTSITGVVVARARARGEVGDTADPAVLTETMAALIYLRGLVLVAPLDPDWSTHVVDDILLPVLHHGGRPAQARPRPVTPAAAAPRRLG